MYASLKDKLPPDVWDYPSTGRNRDHFLLAEYQELGPA